MAVFHLLKIDRFILDPGVGENRYYRRNSILLAPRTFGPGIHRFKRFQKIRKIVAERGVRLCMAEARDDEKKEEE